MSKDTSSLNFIEEIIEKDIADGKNGGRVHTRFPPEPNGCLHIGHAKAICIDFGIAAKYDGLCNLRFDDTNPVKEDVEYIEAIMEDIKWLGFDWEDRLYYASDYFEKFYQYAVELIKRGRAYVDSLSPEEIRRHRGTLTAPGRNSPHRDRSVKENLDLFERMKKGKFENGEHILRAKIDMASPNLNMRDPVMYRIKHEVHHRTKDKWCIYPTYDWAHGLEDATEKITHSLCDTEFENHRPLYDWFLKQLGTYHPRQIEFARLNITYTVLAKRRLRELVDGGHVNGWDDPRMPTLSGMRRRGCTPGAIRAFCDRIGVAKKENTVEAALFEHCLRDDLNKRAPRVMGVLRPLKVVITNYPENQTDELDAVNNPEDESAGTRKVPFSRELYIEREDFRENPPRKYFRLAPGREVRLRYGYYIKCEEAIKDKKTGEILELHCTYDPETRGGQSPDGRRVKGTIHWVSVSHALKVEARLYDRLFNKEFPENVGEGGDFKDNFNPGSLEIRSDAVVEPSLKNAKSGDLFQFERQGYFCVDPDSTSGKLVFNRTVPLRDTWAKIEKAQSR